MTDTAEGAGADILNTHESLPTLVENHGAFLRFLERRVSSKEAAEDLLQEALAAPSRT